MCAGVRRRSGLPWCMDDGLGDALLSFLPLAPDTMTIMQANEGPEGGDDCQKAFVSDPGKNSPASSVQGALDANGTVGGSDIGGGQGQDGVNENLPQPEVR